MDSHVLHHGHSQRTLGKAQQADPLRIGPGLMNQPIQGGAHLPWDGHDAVVELGDLEQGSEAMNTDRQGPGMANNSVIPRILQIADATLTRDQSTKHQNDRKLQGRKWIGQAEAEVDVAEGVSSEGDVLNTTVCCMEKTVRSAFNPCSGGGSDASGSRLYCQKASTSAPVSRRPNNPAMIRLFRPHMVNRCQKRYYP
jgi:hypothetical protein